MAGRAATAVKSKTTSKPRAVAKPKAATKSAARTTLSTPSSSATATVDAPPKPRRRVKPESRTRIYWAVFNEKLKRVAVFEFDQKGEAEKRAAKLMNASGEHHFIQKIKAAVQTS